MKRKSTTEEFIKKARKIHGDKYDYSKVEYINDATKVCIICPTHGEFWQTPNNHLSGKGCKKCAIFKMASEKRKDKKLFIEEATKKHKGKYNYSNVKYKNNTTKVCIICPTHSEFWQTPAAHLKGQGCPKCGHRSFKYNTEEWINIVKEKHNNKYNYSKVEYKNTHSKVCIVCPIHGEFWQTPAAHLKGQGCPKCADEINGLKKVMGVDNFIKKSNLIHCGKYDYSKVNYINNQTKVCIICPKHGEFWQAPNKHLLGQGCPICSNSIIEEKTKKFLNENNIEYNYQYRTDWLKNKNGSLLSIDFYLPKYNLAIECQGIQHFKVVEHFGGKDMFSIRLSNDKIKKSLCEQHKINVLYIIDKNIRTTIDLYNKNNTILIDKISLEKIKSVSE